MIGRTAPRRADGRGPYGEVGGQRGGLQACACQPRAPGRRGEWRRCRPRAPGFSAAISRSWLGRLTRRCARTAYPPVRSSGYGEPRAITSSGAACAAPSCLSRGCPGGGGELGEGVLPYGARGAADGGVQHRPQLEGQVLVEAPGQVVVQALVQDGVGTDPCAAEACPGRTCSSRTGPGVAAALRLRQTTPKFSRNSARSSATAPEGLLGAGAGCCDSVPVCPVADRAVQPARRAAPPLAP